MFLSVSCWCRAFFPAALVATNSPMADFSMFVSPESSGDTYLLRYNVVRQFLMQPEHDGKVLLGWNGAGWLELGWNLEDFQTGRLVISYHTSCHTTETKIYIYIYRHFGFNCDHHKCGFFKGHVHFVFASS